jgi:transcriptional regulator with XRE-family HTH domain
MIISGRTAWMMIRFAVSNSRRCSRDKCVKEVFIATSFVSTKIFGYLCQNNPQIYKFAKDTKKKDTNIFGTHPTFMHFLGKNLRHLRKQSSRTQSEVASLIQKGQTTIGNWENGISEPSLNELLIISNYFDITVDTLLKVDLAETQLPQISRATSAGKPYSLSEWEPLKTEEPGNAMAYVLKELKDMQQQIEQLNARLPKDPDSL